MWVNDPAQDTHQADQTTQSETAIAVAGSHVAVGYNNSQQNGLFLTAGSGLTGYSYSADGGASYTDGGTVPFRSADGGKTFAPGVQIATVTEAVPNGLLFLGPGRYMRDLEFPAVALRGNAIYVAWNDGASGHSHIRLATSANGGRTWAVRFVTHGSGDEVQPALSADSSGVHLLYYQRNRNNTLDVLAGNSRNGTGFSQKRGDHAVVPWGR